MWYIIEHYTFNLSSGKLELSVPEKIIKTHASSERYWNSFLGQKIHVGEK